MGIGKKKKIKPPPKKKRILHQTPKKTKGLRKESLRKEISQ
ncbi:hypothetical protein HpDR51_21180 [Helicobacter pylori]